MRVNWRTEWPQWLLILGMLVAAAATWSSAPDRFPVHWNWTGEVDRYGEKVEGVLLLPVMTLAIYLLMLLLPRIDPGRANYPRFAGAYTTIRLVFVVVMAVIYAIMQGSARGYPVDTSRVMPILIGGMLVVMGNLMGKIRPNWFVGIRTPWTLSSKRSWIRTHRVGGLVMVGFGLLLVIAGLVPTSWFLGVTTAVGMAGILWVILYSYLVWRDDPDKSPPSSTLPG